MTNSGTTEFETRKAVQATPDLDKLARLFIDSFPQLSVDDQQLALMIYHLLAEGESVSCDRLADALTRSANSVIQTLKQWPAIIYDESDRIVGFLGLSIIKTQHQLAVDGKTVYTWCAWDTLFIPELLNSNVNISSTCGATGDAIRLRVSPAGIQSVEPGGVVVSFLTPDENELREDVTASFCHFVYFFRSREDGASWVAQHEGTFLLSLDEAFKVGRMMNAIRYKETLKKPGTYK